MCLCLCVCRFSWCVCMYLCACVRVRSVFVRACVRVSLCASVCVACVRPCESVRIYVGRGSRVVGLTEQHTRASASAKAARRTTFATCGWLSHTRLSARSRNKSRQHIASSSKTTDANPLPRDC
mmetsp:Transcript_11020/g.17457  ORF Transcript_11020/g.17457 Transcript_11020/m.17457 type:complete len:124 (-) Transcript_11020:654-1025(-)